MALIGNDDAPITFQIFADKRSKYTVSKPKILHLRPNAENLNLLSLYQKKGVGIFVMVNKGDGRGRKAENVTQIRALFIDLDGAPWQPVAEKLRPHLRVESSPGRYHLYWKVSDCSLDQFKPIQQAIANRFAGDKSCNDRSRVMRVPGFFHQKGEPVMTKLLEVNHFPPYDTQAVINGLELKISQQGMPSPSQGAEKAFSGNFSGSFKCAAPGAGVEIDLAVWAAKNPAFDIISTINAQYRLGPIRDGKQHIVCPFEHEHTDKKRDDRAAFVANASANNGFAIHCMHSHCVDRDRLEFLSAMLEKGWIPVTALQGGIVESTGTLPIKRPRWVYYCAQEISQFKEASPLSAREFQIWLHLMHVAFSTYDGTLPDNKNQITRILELKLEEWAELRVFFIENGWLHVKNGCLFHPINRREYEKAIRALQDKAEAGRKGGQSTQSKRNGG